MHTPQRQQPLRPVHLVRSLLLCFTALGSACLAESPPDPGSETAGAQSDPCSSPLDPSASNFIPNQQTACITGAARTGTYLRDCGGKLVGAVSAGETLAVLVNSQREPARLPDQTATFREVWIRNRDGLLEQRWVRTADVSLGTCSGG